MGDFAFLLLSALAVLGVRLWRNVSYIFSYLPLERKLFFSTAQKQLLSAPWLKLGASSLSCRGCGGGPAALAAEGGRGVRHRLGAPEAQERPDRIGRLAHARARRIPRASACAHGTPRERPHAHAQYTPRAHACAHTCAHGALRAH